MRISPAAALAITMALASGCSRDDVGKPVDAKSVAEAQGRLAATPEQARLWKEAASKGAAEGVENASLVEHPVQPRRRVSVTDRKAEPGKGGFAEGATGARILALPQTPQQSFAGSAKIVQVESDRVVLDLGNQRLLDLAIHVRGRPLAAKTDGFARVDLRLSDDPLSRREIIAVRLPDNNGILSVQESGREPVSVKVPLFQLTARQTGTPEANSMPVELRVGSETRVLKHGQTVEFPGAQLVVQLESSIAYTGPSAAAAEGPPYAIRLKAWPIK